MITFDRVYGTSSGRLNHVDIKIMSISRPCSISGAPWIARKMANKATPTLIFEQDEEKIKITMQGVMMSREEICTYGIPYEQKEPDGSLSDVSFVV